MTLYSRVPEYSVEEKLDETFQVVDHTNHLPRDFEQVAAEVQQLLVHSIKVLNMQDAITVRLQVLQQSLQEHL